MYLIYLGILAVLLIECGLLAAPRLRETALGRRIEAPLRSTRVYALVQRLYWNATPAFFRRWSGMSRACTFRDLLDYPRNHEQFEREVAATKARAQLVQADPAGFERWSTPDGDWWIPAGASAGLLEVLTEQRCDIYGGADHGVRADDIVLDCGANVGCFTRRALTLGARLVVAIEPGPDNLECLQRNLASEIAAGKVIVYPHGLWHSEGNLRMSGSGVGWRVSDDDAGDAPGSLTIALTTIDKLRAELRLERVDFVKMDIEGAEAAALQGAHATLANCRPTLAIAGYHNREDSETIPRAVRAAWPDCQFRYGPCHSGVWVRPDVIVFHQ